MPVKFYPTNAVISFALVFLFLIQSVAAQNLSSKQISAKVEEYINAAVKEEFFSGSILVAKNGKPIINKAYGMANYELSVPNTPDTIFRLGSITKQFTATAIMRLQEKEKLNVNDSICKYLENCSPAWQTVTIRNLLTHTSGIPDYTSLPDFKKSASQPLTNAELIARFKDMPLEFAVGEGYRYSNTAYNLLGAIIEKVSGKTYADYLQENIFAPLKMKNTGYDVSSKVIKNRAAGYLIDKNSMSNADFLDMSIPYSAGAIYSTTGDLLIWDQALETEKILSRKSLEEMFTPFKNDYGFGFGITEYLGHKEIYHGGGIFGFATQFSRFPDDKITIIVLSNNQRTEAGKITNSLAAIIFGKPYIVPQKGKVISPKILEKYVGQYKLLSGRILNIILENGKLFGQPSPQEKMEIFAVSETHFFLKIDDSQFTFDKDAQGKITGITLIQNGKLSKLPKVIETTPK